VAARYDNSFPYELTAQVKKFKITRIRGNDIKEEYLHGRNVTGEAKTMLETTKSRDWIIFKEIKAEGSDEVPHDLNSLVFTVQ